MPAWYDIFEMSLARKIDVVQIEQSAQRIRDLIAREIERGVAPEHIVLAGFSQRWRGRLPYRIMTNCIMVIDLSTYLATKDSLQLSDANKQLNIAIHHGTHDNVVPEQLGRQAKDWLEARFTNQATTYPMKYPVCLPQIKLIGQWLNTVLA